MILLNLASKMRDNALTLNTERSIQQSRHFKTQPNVLRNHCLIS